MHVIATWTTNCQDWSTNFRRFRGFFNAALVEATLPITGKKALQPLITISVAGMDTPNSFSASHSLFLMKRAMFAANKAKVETISATLIASGIGPFGTLS